MIVGILLARLAPARRMTCALRREDDPRVVVRLDAAIVLVGEHDDGDQRIGPQEILPLRLELLIARRGLDEEPKPALELGLVAAAVLPDADDELTQVGLELRQHRFARRRRRVLRVPVEEAEVLVRGHRWIAGFHPRDEVSPIVHVSPVRLRIADAEPAEARGDDAHVHVRDRRELAPGLRRTVRERVARLQRRIDGVARVVHAVRVQEAADEARHRVREDGLFVRHRRRVVDREQEIDLVDRGRHGLGERRRVSRLDRVDRPTQAARRDEDDQTRQKTKHRTPAHETSSASGEENASRVARRWARPRSSRHARWWSGHASAICEIANDVRKRIDNSIGDRARLTPTRRDGAATRRRGADARASRGARRDTRRSRARATGSNRGAPRRSRT